MARDPNIDTNLVYSLLWGCPRKTPDFGNSPDSHAVAVRSGVMHVLAYNWLIDWEEHNFIVAIAT